MAQRRRVNNLLALAVLAYLVRQPMHPYELGRTLRENGDARSIRFNQGTLYMVFQQLERVGFVTAQETTREGQRPERTVYALTAAGREELGHWLRDLVEDPAHEYPHFVAALSLIGALHPDQAVELLRRRLQRLGEQRDGIVAIVTEAASAGVHPLFLVEEDYRLALLGAEVTFVERFVERITDPVDGWGRLWAEVRDRPAGPNQQEAE